MRKPPDASKHAGADRGHRSHPMPARWGRSRAGYLPCQFGVRFSTKAAGPSMPSSVFSRKR